MTIGKGYADNTARSKPEYNTVQPTGSRRHSLDTANRGVFLEASDAAEANSTTIMIKATAHVAKAGDMIRFTSGALEHVEIAVLSVTTNEITLAGTLSVAPSAADTFNIMRWVTPSYDEDGSITAALAPPAGGFATEAKQDTQITEAQTTNTRIGSLTETAPASDTASSGLNGRLQRIAQRLTSLIALLPSSIGQKASADSLSVVMASDAAAPLPTGASTLAEQQAQTALLTTIDAKDFATETTLAAAAADIALIESKDFSTLTEQQSQTTLLGSIDGDTEDLAATVATPGSAHAATGVSVLGSDGTDSRRLLTDNTGRLQVDATITGGGDATLAEQQAQTALLTTIDADTGSIAASATSIDGKINSNYGAASGAIRTAAQIGNASAVADFNAGNVSAQTLRTVIATDQSAIPASQSGTWNINNVSGTVSLPTGASTSAKQDNQITELQDIEADIEAMSAKLPASLGAKTSANSFSIVPASDYVTPPPAIVAGTITSAQITVGTGAVRATVSGSAPNAARKKLMIKPSKNNTGAIYLGASGVTTSNGLEIIGPDRLEFEFDSGDYYLISDTAAQVVDILEKA